MVRRVIVFVFSVALLGAGGYLIYERLACMLGLLDYSCHFRVIVMLAAVSMAFLGAYILWADIIRPLFKSAKK